MNFVFISPNFPGTCANFCDRLHGRGDWMEIYESVLDAVANDLDVTFYTPVPNRTQS